MPEPKRHLLSWPAFAHLSRMIPLGEAMRIELTGDPEEALEGAKAFAEKGKPEWKMR